MSTPSHIADRPVAVLGQFDVNLKPTRTIDASAFASKYQVNGGFELPAKLKSTLLSTGHVIRDADFLQIRSDGRLFHVKVDDYPDTLLLGGTSENPLQLVYGLYINPSSNWRSVVTGQLYELKSYGLLNEARLHVVITDPANTKGVTELITEVCGDQVNIVFFRENRFEYWAIDHIWRLAQQNPSHNFAYLHSKGMSYNAINRVRFERVLTTRTFQHWRTAVQKLNSPGIDKVGLFPSAKGWVWYNFWYAKGSYLSKCEQPIATPERHYYESWLFTGNRSSNGRDCYSIESDAVGKVYSPKESGICVHSHYGSIDR